MKVSYNWLQEYIEETLPPVEELVEVLTMHSFEIEGVEKVGDAALPTDYILDVKILPNRAHDCLSHYGIASEIASVCDLTRKPLLPKVTLEKTDTIKISLDTDKSLRAVMVYISGVNIGPSPQWLRDKLGLLGHRSINSVVDITNYLTYAFGQPMHAFDAAKVAHDKKGNIAMSIRAAKKGEKIKLLDGREYDLDSSMVVIADKEKALDVAGVMGGEESKVTEATTDIILSLSHFDAVSIRKTSKKLSLRTDASQRFENDLSPMYVEWALPYALKLIVELAGGQIIGGVDVYPKPQKQSILSISVEKISKTLGKKIGAQEMISLLARQNIIAEEVHGGTHINVSVPFERLDIAMPEDVAEEVGRLYGYGNIAPVSLETLSAGNIPAVEVNPVEYVSQCIRQTLVGKGFSEIYTYAFALHGDVEIENPLAGDKKFLRMNLATGMEHSLEHNFKFLDLLGMSEVTLFEIGKVFTREGESLHLSLGARYPKGKKSHQADEEVVTAIHAIEKALGISIGDVSVVGGVAEIDLARILAEVQVPEKYPEHFWNISEEHTRKQSVYKPISPYPFAVRDVAFFSDKKIDEGQMERDMRAWAGLYLVRVSLFDVFTKVIDGHTKTSYAYRLVFQAPDKTLVEEEISASMNNVYDHIKNLGFEIR